MQKRSPQHLRSVCSRSRQWSSSWARAPFNFDIMFTIFRQGRPEKKHQKVDSRALITSFDQVWLKVGSHKLLLHDQMILMNGEDLNNRHINFAQYLLHT